MPDKQSCRPQHGVWISFQCNGKPLEGSGQGCHTQKGNSDCSDSGVNVKAGTNLFQYSKWSNASDRLKKVKNRQIEDIHFTFLNTKQEVIVCRFLTAALLHLYCSVSGSFYLLPGLSV